VPGTDAGCSATDRPGTTRLGTPAVVGFPGLVVISTSDANALERARSLFLAQSPPAPLDRPYVESNLLRYYVVLHDVQSGDTAEYVRRRCAPPAVPLCALTHLFPSLWMGPPHQGGAAICAAQGHVWAAQPPDPTQLVQHALRAGLLPGGPAQPDGADPAVLSDGQRPRRLGQLCARLCRPVAAAAPVSAGRPTERAVGRLATRPHGPPLLRGQKVLW